MGSGGGGPVGGQVGVGEVVGSTNVVVVVVELVTQKLKVLLKEHKGILQVITVENMKTGAHNPLGLLK